MDEVQRAIREAVVREMYSRIVLPPDEQADLEAVEMMLEERDYRRASDIGEDFRKLKQMLGDYRDTAVDLVRASCGN